MGMMLFRWVVQDVVLPLVKVWRRHSWGIGLGDDPQRLCHLPWADATYMVSGARSVEIWRQCRELEDARCAHAGLLLRSEKS